MRGWWLLVLGATACTDSVDLSLKLPTEGEIQSGYDLSCVSHIWVIAFGSDRGDIDRPPDDSADLVEIDPEQPLASFADVQRVLRDQVDLEMPKSGLLAVAVSGALGSPELPYHESLFFGGAPYSGADLRIKLNPSLSCAQRTQVSVRPVNLLDLADSRTCTPVASGRAFAADLRPLALGSEAPRMTFEFGASANSQWTNGTTIVETFASSANTRTCPAVGFGDPAENGGGRCLGTLAEGAALCAGAGELELPIVAFDFAAQSISEALVEEYGAPVIGAVYEASALETKTPIANATVTLDDPSQGVVVYVERGPTSLVPRDNAMATDAEGWFMIYLRGEPTTITVAGPNHKSQRYTVASAVDYPSTVIAALPRN